LVESIFRDRNKLSPRYIPQVLPHREEQIRFLDSLFAGVLENIAESHLRVAQIVGGVGTGKTVTTIRFGESLEGEARRRKISLTHVYINLKLQGGNRVLVYRYLVEKGAPSIYSTSLSAEEMLRNLVKYLQAENRYLLISLDEVDYYVRHYSREPLLYDLTRIGELSPGEPCGVVGLIVTARNREFYKGLDRAELSTLGRNSIDFAPYTSGQIFDILAQRVEEAFRPGVVTDEVLEYVADVTARPPVNGDVRHALDLLLYSGNLAENRGSGRVLLDHVRRVHGETYPMITSEDIMNLEDRKKIVLLAVARALKTKRTAYVSLRDIRETLSVVCEESDVKPIDHAEEYVQDLSDRGIVDIKSLTSIGISGIPTEDLDRFLDNMIERVKSELE